MTIILNMAFALLCTSCLSIMFNTPRKTIFISGLIGMVGWTAYVIAFQANLGRVAATFIGAFLVNLLAQISARKFKKPVLVYVASGIIPLVPGAVAYESVRAAAEANYILGLEHATLTFMLTGAIVMGMAASAFVYKGIRKILRQG